MRRCSPPYLERSRIYATTANRLRDADALAPNRLLFTALAFRASGLILRDPASREESAEFIGQALALQHVDGYFIEGGGFDSSYNGVACAVGLRLLSLEPENKELAAAMHEAMKWQRGRIAANGEILTAGNRRVREGGESFLGVEKKVDAAHTVEALMLSAALRDDAGDLALARAVARYYRRTR